jgi:large conductance mechanosensitive channel
MKKGVKHTFIDFLHEFKIVTAALGFVFALATNDLVHSFVNNLVMPFLDPLIKDGTWKTATFSFYGINIAWGNFLSNFLHFTILLLVIYIVIKKIMKYSVK